MAEKPREVRYNRPLNKGKADEVSQPFRFDIINQLANIPARITLYELLRLSKSTREALREALADAEVFVTQLPIGSTIDEPHSLNVSCVPTNIVFTQKTCKFRADTPDPYTSRGTSAPQRSRASKWTQTPRLASCQGVSWNIYLFLPID